MQSRITEPAGPVQQYPFINSVIPKGQADCLYTLQIRLQGTVQICIVPEPAGDYFRSWDPIRTVRVEPVKMSLDILDQSRLLADAAAYGDPLRIEDRLQVEDLHCNCPVDILPRLKPWDSNSRKKHCLFLRRASPSVASGLRFTPQPWPLGYSASFVHGHRLQWVLQLHRRAPSLKHLC